MNVEIASSLKEQLIKGQIEFAIDLYRLVREEYDSNANITTLPLSVASDLLRLNIGARGESRDEIRKVLHLPSPNRQTGENKEALVLSKMMKELEAQQPFTVRFRNYMLIDKCYPVDLAFKNTMAIHFPDTRLMCFDFQTASQRVVSRVTRKGQLRYEHRRESRSLSLSKESLNAGTKLVTRSAVKNLSTLNKVLEPQFKVETELASPLSKLGFFNGVYFRGRFHVKFKKSRTAVQSFFPQILHHRTVKMMHTTDEFRIASVDQLDARVVEIPYEDHLQYLYVILPNKVEGLAEVEARLFDDSMLLQWPTFMSQLETKLVSISLPRYFDQTEVDMMYVYRRLGVQFLTDQHRADLSGVSTKKGLCLSEHLVLSQMRIKESGAKNPIDKQEMTGRNITDFVANYPFLLLVSDNKNNSIQCIGRVVTPNKVRKFKTKAIRKFLQPDQTQQVF